ncbi:MAG: hypothetical protein ABIV06_03660, partial [Thermoanaerobaculia bacterium]
MRLATYNFHMGGRLEHWQRLLEATQADLLFVQEARDPATHGENPLTPPELEQIFWQCAPRR